jgi:hypothetical protein
MTFPGKRVTSHRQRPITSCDILNNRSHLPPLSLANQMPSPRGSPDVVAELIVAVRVQRLDHPHLPPKRSHLISIPKCRVTHCAVTGWVRAVNRLLPVK